MLKLGALRLVKQRLFLSWLPIPRCNGVLDPRLALGRRGVPLCAIPAHHATSAHPPRLLVIRYARARRHIVLTTCRKRQHLLGRLFKDNGYR